MLITPLILGRQAGWPLWSWACLAISALLLAGFVMFERRVAARGGSPLLSPKLLSGPAAEALREHRLDPEAVSWLQTNFLKTELELGHCLGTPAEGPCECDLVLTCAKSLTTSDYAPRLRARLEVERQLIDDATARGWQREIERHAATKARLEYLLDDLAQERPTHRLASDASSRS